MEDFVIYEIAVKLEEKGFKQGFGLYGCKFVYSDETVIKRISDIGAYDEDYFGCNIPCPTISQVLKWLRETKNIEVVASFSYRNKVWGYQVGDMTLLEDSILSYDFSFPTYEHAALTGIEYVLDNLI